MMSRAVSLKKRDDREVHKVGKVVTKEWRKANSAEPGFCIRFSLRDSNFRLNSLGPLCLRQCLWLMWGRAMVCSRWFRTLKSFLLAGSACTVPFNGDKKLSCPFIRQLKKLKCESRPKKTKFYRLEQEYPIFSEGSSL